MTNGARRLVRALALVLTVTAVEARSESSAPSTVASNGDMVSEFSRTCAGSKSLKGLKDALAKGGWKLFASLAETHLEREIAAVTPMLEAQGLASDYVVYGRDAGGLHLELALSVTKRAISGDRKLIGCSMYNFDAVSPVDIRLISSLAPNSVGIKSTIGDVQFEKWEDVFGKNSGMRAVFLPADSPMRSQVGFSGMMLGTHFLDAVE